VIYRCHSEDDPESLAKNHSNSHSENHSNSHSENHSEIHSVNFYEILDASCWEFEAAIQIYIASFHENERRPNASIIEMLECGRSRLIAGEARGEIVFMALLYPLNGTPFLLGDYLATAESQPPSR